MVKKEKLFELFGWIIGNDGTATLPSCCHSRE